MPPGPFLLIETWCCAEETTAWTSQGLQQLWKACLLGTMMRNQSKGESWAQFVYQLNSALQKARPTTPTKGASRARSCLNRPGSGQSQGRTSEHLNSTGRVSSNKAGYAQAAFLFGKREKEMPQKKHPGRRDWRMQREGKEKREDMQNKINA